MMFERKNALYLSISFLAGTLVSYAMIQTNLVTHTPISNESSDLQEFQENYTFINPLLSCGDTELSRATKATADAIEENIFQYIAAEKYSGYITNASVYYRDLKGGPWALINGDLQSTPGSLLKVPLVLSIYRHAEKEPGFFTRKIEFKDMQDETGRQTFKPDESITYGKTYTVADLVTHAIKNSDNNASLLLSRFLSPVEMVEAFKKLGIKTPDPSDTNGEYTMDVRTYASFFRILYNASYLDRESSEYLLSILAQSPFTQGIVGGVPKGVSVSHKFGEAKFTDGRAQLHDCGIVYKPEHPYLLCVMTQGTNVDLLSEAIRNISRITYETLDKIEK